jgi:hypothetical protein
MLTHKQSSPYVGDKNPSSMAGLNGCAPPLNYLGSSVPRRWCTGVLRPGWETGVRGICFDLVPRISTSNQRPT